MRRVLPLFEAKFLPPDQLPTAGVLADGDFSKRTKRCKMQEEFFLLPPAAGYTSCKPKRDFHMLKTLLKVLTSGCFEPFSHNSQRVFNITVESFLLNRLLNMKFILLFFRQNPVDAGGFFLFFYQNAAESRRILTHGEETL